MHEDLRYGLTFAEVVREIDSPFFSRPTTIELPSIDPDDQIFYGQFLMDYFRDEREIGSVIEGAGELHACFTNWKKRALFSVEPVRKTQGAAAKLHQIYERMDLFGLFRYISGEVDKSLVDPEYCNVSMERIDLLLFEGVVGAALELDEELQIQRARDSIQVQIVFPPPDSGNAFFHGY